MSGIKWARVSTLLEEHGFFGDAYKKDEWPERMTIDEISILQSPPIKNPPGSGCIYSRDYSIQIAIEKSVETGKLPSVNQVCADRSRTGKNITLPIVSADDFRRWLELQDEKPSEHIQAWIKATATETPSTPAPEKPLATVERNSLLTIIAVLCKEAKIPYDKPAKAANFIESTAALMGVSIGESTIEGHLKKIPNALGTRMK